MDPSRLEPRLKARIIKVLVPAFVLLWVAFAAALHEKHNIPLIIGDESVSSCEYCHDPRVLKDSVQAWAASDEKAKFFLYLTEGEEKGIERYICYGCHDGTVASSKGPALEGQHPVAFEYEDAVERNRLNREHDLQPAFGNAVVGRLTGSVYPLYDGVMECVSIHSIHSEAPLGLRGPFEHLCMDCHEK